MTSVLAFLGGGPKGRADRRQGIRGTGASTERRQGDRRKSPLRSVLARFVFSAFLGFVIVCIGMLGMFFMTAPAFVAILGEPLLLLLTPGIFVSVVFEGPHDLEAAAVVLYAFSTYLVVFFTYFSWRERQKRLRRIAAQAAQSPPEFVVR
jgi:hypothetical protein